MSKATVVAAMSGGVDSAVAAALLKQEGYDVIGVTLQIWQEHEGEEKAGGCCSLGAVEDARRASAKIGIPHYVLNFREFFAEKVIQPFIDEYSRGRTPNPCVECNRSVKFDELLLQAEQLGADMLATGHYARIRYNESTGRHELMRARNLAKDQSYALYTLTQRQLSKTIFPLGELGDKTETRRLATELGLSIANKPDSQDICFVPRAGYIEFLKENAPAAVRPGRIVTLTGEDLGEHPGVAFFTVGQRKRLPASNQGALFVVELDAERNIVIVGHDEDLFAEGFRAGGITWSGCAGMKSSDPPLEVFAKIRYNARTVPAKICLSSEDGALVGAFDEPQRAVTPGQAAVCYGGEGDEVGNVVLCGGTIDGPLNKEALSEIGVRTGANRD